MCAPPSPLRNTVTSVRMCTCVCMRMCVHVRVSLAHHVATVLLAVSPAGEIYANGLSPMHIVVARSDRLYGTEAFIGAG